MKLVLDAGALMAIDKRDQWVGAWLRAAQRDRVPVRTSPAVVAQVWRDGARQANLARVLSGVGTAPLDLETGKRLGALLGISQSRDVVDAHVASLVDDGDHLLTSDPQDLRRLLSARKVKATVTTV